MSTLKVVQIQDTSGGNTSTCSEINHGRVRVWCKWKTNGGAAISDSYGVSSVADNGTGYSYVNFSTSFNNDDYAVVADGQEDSGGGGRLCNPRTPETNRCQFEFRNTGNSTRDAINLWAIFIGDL